MTPGQSDNKEPEFKDCEDREQVNDNSKHMPTEGAGILSENIVAAVNKIQLSPFRSERPDVWFFIVESDFSSSRVTSDESKYIAVLKALDPQTLDEISDIVLNPPAQNKYEHLKKIIIQRFSKSKERQLSKLLNDVTLENKTPSQLLREMTELAAGGLSDEVLHSLWSMRMPPNLTPMLVMSQHLDLDGLAEMADRVIDSMNFSSIMATSTAPQKDNQACSGCLKLAEEVREMRQMFTQFLKVTQQTKSHDDNNQWRPRQSRSRTRHRSSTPRICYYHQKFGEASYKCQPNCSYKAKTQQGN